MQAFINEVESTVPLLENAFVVTSLLEIRGDGAARFTRRFNGLQATLQLMRPFR
jgi:hypothetical protein